MPVKEERVHPDIDALLQHLDHPRPRPDARTIMKRARPVPSWARIAAGTVLAVVVAGAAYAAPGSPLPALFDELARVAGRASVASPPSAVASAPVSQAGIALEPGEKLVIAFASTQSTGEARVTLTDSALVMVRSSSEAAAFTSEHERLLIDNRSSSATFEILIPRSMPRVEILVAGMRVYLKTGARITADASARVGDRYVLPLRRGATAP